MPDVRETVLTDRQVEVLELRANGLTQSAVADVLGTTDSNVSAVEQAAESNIEKAKNTVTLARTIRTPVQFTVESGIAYDEFIETIYDRGDEADVKVAFSGPELSGVLFEELDAHVNHGRLETAVKVGLTADGDVNVFPVDTESR